MLKNKLSKINTPKAIAIASTIIAIATIASVVVLASPEDSSAQRTFTLYDGDLIKSPESEDVHIVKYINNQWYRRLILNPQIFNSYNHLSWDNIKLVSTSTIHRHTESHLVMEVYPNGQPVNGKVYYLRSLPNSDIGMKHHVQMTPAQFEAVGLDWNSIYRINHIEAGDGFYAEGPAINTSNFRSIVSSPININANDLSGITNPEDYTSYIESLFRGITGTNTTDDNNNNNNNDNNDDDTDNTDDDDNDALPEFKISLSTRISGVDLKQNEEKNVAQYTLTSKENDTTIDDITLLFEAQGGSSKDHDIEDTFSEISLILDGDEISTISTEDDDNKISSSSKKHTIKFDIDNDITIEEGDSISMQVRVTTKEDLDAEHIQSWIIKVDDVDIVGDTEEETVTSQSRKFTLSETIEPFLSVSTQAVDSLQLTASALVNDSGITSDENNKILQIAIDNEKTGTKYNSIIQEIKIKLALENSEDSLRLKDVMKNISLRDDSGKTISRSTKSVTTSSKSTTITFSNISIPVKNDSQKVIYVYANIEPLLEIYAEQAKELDSTLEISVDSDDIEAVYTSTRRDIDDNRIGGETSSEIYSLLSSGRISSTILTSPQNPSINTADFTEIATSKVQITSNNGRINTVKIAIKPKNSSHKPHDYLSKMRLSWDSNAVEKNISNSSSYTKLAGNKYVVTFNGLNIDLNSNDAKELSIELQAKDTSRNFTSSNWEIAPITRFITATIDNKTKYTDITSSKSFSIEGGTDSDEFITIEDEDTSIGSRNVDINTSNYVSKTVLKATLENTSSNNDYDVNINELTVNLQGSGNNNLRNVVDSVSICMVEHAANCSSRSSNFQRAIQLGKSTSIPSTTSDGNVRITGIKNLTLNNNQSREIYVMLTFKPQSRGINETMSVSIDGNTIKGQFVGTSTNINSNNVSGDSASTTYTLQTTDSISSRYDTITTSHVSSTTKTNVAKIRVNAGLYATSMDSMMVHITGKNNLNSYFSSIKLVSGSSEYTGVISGNIVNFSNLGTISAKSNKVYTLQVQARNPSNQNIQNWTITMPSNGIVGTSNGVRKYTGPAGMQKFTVGSSVFITKTDDNPSARSFKTADASRSIDLLKFKLDNRSSSSQTGFSIPVVVSITTTGSENIDDVVKTVKLIEGNRTIATKTIQDSSLNSQTLTFSSINVGSKSSRVFKVTALVNKHENENYQNAVELSAKVENVQNAPGTALGNTMTLVNLGDTTLNTSVINSSRVHLSWDRVAGASGYYIERCKRTATQITNDQNCTNFGSSIKITNSSTTSRTITSLSGSSSYVFRIRAYDSSNNKGPWSEPDVSDTDLLAPRLSSTSVDGTEVKLSWNTIATATDYNVQHCEHETTSTSECTSFRTVGGASAIKEEGEITDAKKLKEDGRVTITGLEENVKYSFRVRAERNVSPTFSAWSNTRTATTRITKPNSLVVTYYNGTLEDHDGGTHKFGNGNIAISWQSSDSIGVEDEAQYCRTRNNNCVTSYKPATPIEPREKRFVLQDSKGEGETFKFRIRSRLLNRSYQTQWEYLTVRTNMEAPQNLEGDWIGGAVDITWDKVVGADDYVVEYCVRSVWHSADEVHIRDEGSNKKATRITIPSKLYADNSIEYINVRVRATRTQLTPNGAGQLYNGEPTSSEWSQVTDESGSVSNDLDIPIERS